MRGPSRPADAPLRVELAPTANEPAADVLDGLGNRTTGLAPGEAVRRLASVGPNVLATRTITVFGVLVRQLRNPLFILLSGAAAMSAATAE